MQYENMITNIGTALGLAKQPTTTKAKTHLRELGQEGGVLASRLGQLSKVRNRRAHPGATHRLLAQVQQLVRTIKHDSSSKEPEEEATFYKEKNKELTQKDAISQEKPKESLAEDALATSCSKTKGFTSHRGICRESYDPVKATFTLKTSILTETISPCKPHLTQANGIGKHTATPADCTPWSLSEHGSKGDECMSEASATPSSLAASASATPSSLAASASASTAPTTSNGGLYMPGSDQWWEHQLSIGSERNEKGESSGKVGSSFWFDYIAKIHGIGITKKDAYWKAKHYAHRWSPDQGWRE